MKETAERIVKELLKGNPYDSDQLLENIGYRCLGPILVGFVTWLHGQCQRKEYQHLYFMSRDGLVVKRVAGILRYNLPSYSYLYVSRKALQVPAAHLWRSPEELFTSVSVPEKLTLQELFVRFGVSPEVIQCELCNAGMRSDLIIHSDNLISSEVIRAWEILGKRITAISEQQYKTLVDYLKQECFSGGVAIVDIGWYGHMQDALQLVADSAGLNATIDGYYVGLKPGGSRCNETHRFGYLFDAYNNQDLRRVVDRSNTVFESFFSCRHGTCIGYRAENGKVRPCLKDMTPTEANTGFFAEKVRLGAYQFASDWHERTEGAVLTLDPRFVFAEYGAFSEKPNLKEAETIGEWSFEDNGVISKIASPREKSAYLRQPKLLLHDYGCATWKPAFFRRLLGLRLNYGSIINAAHYAKGFLVRNGRV